MTVFGRSVRGWGRKAKLDLAKSFRMTMVGKPSPLSVKYGEMDCLGNRYYKIYFGANT